MTDFEYVAELVALGLGFYLILFSFLFRIYLLGLGLWRSLLLR